MKFEQEKVDFSPISMTIESREELRLLKVLFQCDASVPDVIYGGMDFSADKKKLSDLMNLIYSNLCPIS